MFQRLNLFDVQEVCELKMWESNFIFFVTVFEVEVNILGLLSSTNIVLFILRCLKKVKT